MSAQNTSTGPLVERVTAAEVDVVCFEGTRFRRGYDEDEVDDFLDRVAATLAADARALEEIRAICREALNRPGPRSLLHGFAIRLLTAADPTAYAVDGVPPLKEAVH